MHLTGDSQDLVYKHEEILIKLIRSKMIFLNDLNLS